MAKPKQIVAIAPHRVVASNVKVNGLSRAGVRQLVAAGGFGGSGRHQLTLLDAETGTTQASFGTEAAVVCWYAERSCDGLVAAGFGDCSLRIWNPETNVTRELATLGGIVASVAWSADGKHLFTGNCGDNTVRMWDVARGTVVAEQKTKKSATWFVAMSGDCKRAVSGAGDKAIHVWEPMQGREIASLTGHTGKINGLTFFPDGSRVASASQDRSVRIWDLDREKELFVLGGHTKEVTAVAVAPDGKQLASASSDGTIRLWDVQTGALESVLSVGATIATALTYSADGAELFAGCSDSVVRAFTVRRQATADRDILAALLELVWANPADDGPRGGRRFSQHARRFAGRVHHAPARPRTGDDLRRAPAPRTRAPGPSSARMDRPDRAAHRVDLRDLRAGLHLGLHAQGRGREGEAEATSGVVDHPNVHRTGRLPRIARRPSPRARRKEKRRALIQRLRGSGCFLGIPGSCSFTGG